MPPLLLLACLPPASPPASSMPLRVYTVEWGDSLWSIANRHDVPGGYMTLARLNHIAYPNYILAGSKLKVPTWDTNLPELPALAPVRAALPQAPVEALASARAVPTLAGTRATCLDIGQGAVGCAVSANGALRLTVGSGGRPSWLTGIDTTPSYWASDTNEANEGLVGFRVQLDDDAPLETAIAVAVEQNDLGMSRWQVAIVDAPFDGRALTFEAANFGAGSFVQAGRHADILAADWVLADEPGRDGDGYYLLARQYRYARGALSPADDATLLSRRLFYSFKPTRVAGPVVTGSVRDDLAHAQSRARSTEPEVELNVASQGNARVEHAVADTVLGLRLGGATEIVESRQGTIRRLGDARTGLLYPPNYVPADPSALVGRDALVVEYQPPWWAEPFRVAWL